jgi:hypothetical protein
MDGFKNTIPGIVFLGVISSLIAAFIWENRSTTAVGREPQYSKTTLTTPEVKASPSSSPSGKPPGSSFPAEPRVHGRESEQAMAIPNPAEPKIIVPSERADRFWAEPSRIEVGQPAILHWNITQANEASIDNGIGPIDPHKGSRAIFVTTTTTYTLTATDPSGASSTNSITIEAATARPR